MTRDEVLAIAKEAHMSVSNEYELVLTNGDELERFAAACYERGASAMREHIIDMHQSWADTAPANDPLAQAKARVARMLADAIRALPLESDQ